MTRIRELLEAIEGVRERIRQYESQLRQNEMLTRYALVDPILCALGWDTEDPEQLVPEPRTETGRPDYALKHDGKVLVMVETKPLGSDLTRAREEGFRYCWQNRVPFYVITDGNVWELHDLREMGGKEIFRVKLTDADCGDAARKLLALWRLAMPVVEPALPLVVQQPLLPPTPPPGLPLSEVLSQMRPRQKPPEQIRFPGGTQKPLHKWIDLLVEVARWALPKLQKQDKLPLDNLIGHGEKMKVPRDIGGGWRIEIDYFSAKGCVRKAIRVLKAAGVSADQVFVTL